MTVRAVPAVEARQSLASLVVPIVAALLIIAPALYGIRVWLDPREAWLHPELFGTSEYVWQNKDESLWQRLRKAFDWKAFDPNVNRVRPLSDLTDTIDTIARPYQTRIIGPHPSIAPSAILTAIAAPLFLFLFLRRIGLGLIASAALTGLFISSIGFLSVVVAYIRPAKKVTVVSFCVALYLAERHRRSGSNRSFVALLTVLFVSCFADELDLAKYPIVGLLYWRSLIWRAPTWKRLAFLALPFAYLATVASGLPWLYLHFSVHGAWDALGDGKKLGVLRYLATPSFWTDALTHLSRSILSTVGIGIHTPLTEGVALAAFMAGTLVPIWRRLGSADARYGLGASAVSLVMAACYAMLLDWYPDPSQAAERTYLASFNYYYHSALAVLVIVWLAYLWLTLSEGLATQVTAHRALTTVAAVGCCLAMIGSFATWHQVNRLAHTIHLYPYSTEGLFAELRAHQGELRVSRPDAPVTLTFTREADRDSAEYDRILLGLYGEGWQETRWHEQLEAIKRGSIMKDENLAHLVRAYFPRDSFRVEIRDR